MTLVKGACQEIKNRDKAADDLFSVAVSRIRKPIESLFKLANSKN